MTYRVNEVFYSLQGEGLRAGTPNVFVRFSGCNLTCSVENEGFDCDTEFTSGVSMDLDRLLDTVKASDIYDARSVIFTGGEPALQLTAEIIEAFGDAGWHMAVETNGTKELPDGLHWICVSPKTAEHTLRVNQHINELKYVRRAGQGVPRPSLQAASHLISPAVQPNGVILAEDMRWCIEMVKANPSWRLSCQLHKAWGVR